MGLLESRAAEDLHTPMPFWSRAQSGKVWGRRWRRIGRPARSAIPPRCSLASTVVGAVPAMRQADRSRSTEAMSRVRCRVAPFRSAQSIAKLVAWGFALLLSLAAVASDAADKTDGGSWSLTELKAQLVPAIWIIDGSEFVRYVPPVGGAFLEIRGRLRVPPGAHLAPVVVGEIRVRRAARDRPQELVTFGASIAMCRYVAREVSRQDVSAMTVVDGGRLAASRDRPDAPLKLRWEGSDLDLCLAFPAVGTVGDEVVLEFAGGSFGVPVVDRASDFGDAREPARSRPREWLLSDHHLLFPGVAGLLFLLVGAGALAFWHWRKVRACAAVPPSDSFAVVASSAAIETSAKSTGAGWSGTGNAAGAGSGQHGPAEPRRVGTAHCRTTFAPMAARIGPGKDDFNAALRALLGERFEEAEVLLAAAIAKGLTPAYDCGAWALRGQAAVARGQIPLAIDHFLNALGATEVTSQAALLSAMHLAVIYRTLRLRADADQMEALARAINGSGVTLDPAAVRHIERHAQAYRNALQALRPSWRKRLLRLLSRRSSSPADH